MSTEVDSAFNLHNDGGAAVAGAPENNQYVTFSCADRAFGIDIMSVREIRSWSATTLLPNQPQSACGVLDIRGEVIQVYDLRSMIGAGNTEAGDGHVVVVVAIGDTHVGVLVDAVSDIISVENKDMREAPAHTNGGDIVAGIAKHEDRLVAILNLDKILGSRIH